MRTVEVLQAAPGHRLLLAKRKTASTSVGMQEVKKLEPDAVTLCSIGADSCKTLGIKSAHIKRSSNSPYVAVTLKHPKTGKRVSIALWKLVTGRWEAGWSVTYRDGSIVNLTLENLETEEPKQREEEKEPEPEPEQGPKVVDPAIVELQIGLVTEHAADFQTYLRKTAYKVLNRKIHRNIFELAEDLVSGMLPGLWAQIGRGNVRHTTYEGVRGWAARCVAFQAGMLGKLGGGGRWGHSIPEKPQALAANKIKLEEYSPAFSDAAQAEASGELNPRPTRAAKDADSQWSDTFGGHVQRSMGAAQKRAGISLDIKKPDSEEPEEARERRKKKPAKKRKKKTN